MQLRTPAFDVKLLGTPQPGKGFYLGSSFKRLTAEVRLAHVLDALLGDTGKHDGLWGFLVPALSPRSAVEMRGQAERGALRKNSRVRPAWREGHAYCWFCHGSKTILQKTVGLYTRSPVPRFHLCWCDKTLGKGKVCLGLRGHSPSLKEIRAGTQAGARC